MNPEDRKMHANLMNLVADARMRGQFFWMRAMLMQARRLRENAA